MQRICWRGRVWIGASEMWLRKGAQALVEVAANTAATTRLPVYTDARVPVNTDVRFPANLEGSGSANDNVPITDEGTMGIFSSPVEACTTVGDLANPSMLQEGNWVNASNPSRIPEISAPELFAYNIVNGVSRQQVDTEGCQNVFAAVLTSANDTVRVLDVNISLNVAAGVPLEPARVSVQGIEQCDGAIPRQTIRSSFYPGIRNRWNIWGNMGRGRCRWTRKGAGGIAHAMILQAAYERQQMMHSIADGGIAHAMILQAAYERQLQKFEHSLIGRMDSRGMLISDIEDILRKQWKPISFDLGKGFFTFRFFPERDMQFVWQRGLSKVNRHAIKFQKWEPDFNVKKQTISRNLQWVRFPNLPFEYWAESILYFIARLVGDPVAMDLGRFAGVCIEVDKKASKVNEVLVGKIKGQSGKFFFKQPVEFEEPPAKRSICSKFGHNRLVCPNKERVNFQQGGQQMMHSNPITIASGTQQNVQETVAVVDESGNKTRVASLNIIPQVTHEEGLSLMHKQSITPLPRGSREIHHQPGESLGGVFSGCWMMRKRSKAGDQKLAEP
ncbi:hypothetical protein NE237_000214 [Protea cynaroides]|uniref:DUF4283 domain-containing protein n=1 Tax=Protea cynaroides TaxID=273540 RepID=A0A9Q0KQP2_9MAGN|nr:hypothetical protein NE237_000214 [Protea cynaroides]